MGITVKSVAVYDALISLIDTINHEPDPLMRLTLFSYLAGLYDTRVLPERDKAAYESRERYTIDNIEQVSGSDKKQVYYWASRHQQRKAQPPLKRRYPQDVSGAADITAAFRRRNPAFRDRGDTVEPGE
jgi:hypothetical protein